MLVPPMHKKPNLLQVPKIQYPLKRREAFRGFFLPVKNPNKGAMQT